MGRDRPHGSAARAGDTIAALRVPNYRRFFGIQLGLTVAVRFVPLLLLGPWAGVLTDRMDRRRLIMNTSIASAALSGLLAAGVAAGLSSLVFVYVVSALLGIVNVFAIPGRRAFVNEMVPDAMLGNAIVLNSVANT